MRTIEEIKTIPFFKLTADEKAALREHADKRAAAAPAGREASIAAMMADVLKKAR